MRCANLEHATNPRVWYPECGALATKLGLPEMFISRKTIRESQAIEHTKNLAAFWHEHGKFPSIASKEKAEVRMRQWQCRMRTARIVGYPPFEKEWRMACEALAIELDCPEMFVPTNHEAIAIENTLAVIKHINTHGKYPTAQDPNAMVRSLGCWINRSIRVRNGYDVRYNWYPECESVAEALDHPELFYFRSEPFAEYVTDHYV